MTRLSRSAVLLLAVTLITACSSAADSPPTPTKFVLPTTPPTPTIGDAPATQEASPSRDEPVTPEPTSPPAIEPTLALHPGQRAVPLGVSEGLHNDNASIVAATGRPQMIEFFTFW